MSVRYGRSVMTGQLRVAVLLLFSFALAWPGTPALADGPEDSVGVVDQTTGLWHLRDPLTGETTSFYCGNPGDFPVMGDWDCDGDDNPGLYRQSDGFVYLRMANSQGNAHIRFFFGNPGDIPLAGDFDGDGCDTISIYRPSQGRVFIINELGKNDGGLGEADFSYFFGNPGDKPFVGDFDRDGIDTIGLHRESTGLVYFRNTHSQGNADEQFVYGNPGDKIIAGEWAQKGDFGPDTVGIFRPAAGTFFLRFSNTQGNADAEFLYGNNRMLPVAGDFGPLPGGDPPPPGPILGQAATVPNSPPPKPPPNQSRRDCGETVSIPPPAQDATRRIPPCASSHHPLIWTAAKYHTATSQSSGQTRTVSMETTTGSAAKPDRGNSVS